MVKILLSVFAIPAIFSCLFIGFNLANCYKIADSFSFFSILIIVYINFINGLKEIFKN